MTKKRSYPILKTGNFYFPYLDKGKRFVVADTLELEIDRKGFAFLEVLEKMTKLKRFRKYKTIYFSEYAGPIWDAVNKFVKGKKEYKNCWFVPIRLADYRHKTISASVLKRVR